MKTLFALIFSLIFTACASVTKITEKDGKPLYDAKCRSSTADCHKMASETCKGAYNIVDQSQWLVEYHIMFQCK